MTTNRKNLDALLDNFLTETRRSERGGWAEVTSKDIADLDKIIGAIVDLKCERDSDGDQTINWDLTNRVTHLRVPFRPLPYGPPLFERDRRGLTSEQILKQARDVMGVARLNLSLAQSSFNQNFQMWELEEREIKEKE